MPPWWASGAATADDPDIQASFLAVRSDAYARPDVLPPVHHGSPTRWMQRSIARAGDLTVAAFASNQRRVRPPPWPQRGRIVDGAPLHGRARRGGHLGGGRGAPRAAARGRRRARAARRAGRAVRGSRHWTRPATARDRSSRTSRSTCTNRSPGRRTCCSAGRSMLCSCSDRPASRCGCRGSPRCCGRCSRSRPHPPTWRQRQSTPFPWPPARARDEVAAFVRPLVAHGALRRAEPVCPDERQLL